MLWNHWWNLVCDLRSACARTRTFLWMALCLAGMATRKELLGVTSIVRALGLEPACYDRLLDFFHSPALNLHQLTCAWCDLVFRAHSGILSRERQARPRRRRHQGRQGRTQDARSQETPSTIRVKHQAGVHLRPLLPGRRRTHPSLVQRIRLASRCLWPVASTRVRSFPTATTEPCWTR